MLAIYCTCTYSLIGARYSRHMLYFRMGQKGLLKGAFRPNTPYQIAIRARPHRDHAFYHQNTHKRSKTHKHTQKTDPEKPLLKSPFSPRFKRACAATIVTSSFPSKVSSTLALADAVCELIDGCDHSCALGHRNQYFVLYSTV